MQIVDTNVAIDVLRGQAEAAACLLAAAEGGELLAASEITRFEVLAGMHEDESVQTERFLMRLAWVPVDEQVARRGAALARTYRREHTGIEDADYLIAATVVEFGAGLLTRNVRHFPMLPGLQPAY